MLGKLMKHELKATSRYFILLYGALLLLSIFNKIFLLMGIDKRPTHDTLNTILQAIQICFIIAYVLICAAVFIMTFVFIVMRFYKNLTGDEGYLMHTLPVTSHQHILSKLLISFFWNFCSMITFIISLMILLWGYGFWGSFWNGIRSELNQADMILLQNAKPQLIMMMILFVLALIIGTIQSILFYYLSISIGHLFNKHRILGAVAAYFGISFLIQIISSIASVVITLRMDEFVYDITNDLNHLPTSQAMQKALGYINTSIGIGLLIAIALSIIYFFAINYIMSKKLNLE